MFISSGVKTKTLAFETRVQSITKTLNPKDWKTQEKAIDDTCDLFDTYSHGFTVLDST